MIMVLAADHGGYNLKEEIKKYLKDTRPEIKIVDLGANSNEPVDYPIYGKAAAEAVANKKADLGIVCCGTGIGISIAANKVKGIRCGLVTSVETAELTKKHNNANMIAMGGRTTDTELAKKMVDAWLDSEFMGMHHIKRIEMLDNM